MTHTQRVLHWFRENLASRYSSHEIAALAGMTQPTVNRAIRNDNMNFRTYKKIEEMYGNRGDFKKKGKK